VSDGNDEASEPHETGEPDARAEALDVLTEVPDWQLTPERWERVEQLLDRISDALHDRDDDGLWAATANLELVGPMRITTRLGDVAPGEPPPEPVRDRIVRLVHHLERRTPDEPRGGEDGETSRR
jgi:hypothetical protein